MHERHHRVSFQGSRDSWPNKIQPPCLSSTFTQCVSSNGFRYCCLYKGMDGRTQQWPRQTFTHASIKQHNDSTYDHVVSRSNSLAEIPTMVPLFVTRSCYQLRNWPFPSIFISPQLTHGKWTRHLEFIKLSGWLYMNILTLYAFVSLSYSMWGLYSSFVIWSLRHPQLPYTWGRQNLNFGKWSTSWF